MPGAGKVFKRRIFAERVRRFLSLLAALLLLSALPAQGYFKTGRSQDQEQQLPYDAEAKYHSPIIFIPGIMGSYLVDETGDELWVGGAGEDRSKLMLDDDGERQAVAGSRITASGVMRTAFGVNVYEDFYDWMDGDWTGYGLKLYTYRGQEGNYGYLGRSYFDQPYDFRQDNDKQVGLLGEKVDEVLRKTHSDKVILIAHSMGGYQARMYAAKHSDKVRALIFLSSPHHGAVKPFWAMTEGYNFGVPAISDAYMWEIAHNWPSAAQLQADQPAVYEEKVPWTMEKQFYGDWVSYQTLNHLRAGLMGQGTLTQQQAEDYIKKNLRTGFYNQGVMKEAQEWRTRYNSVTIPSGVRVENINGDKKATDVRYAPRFEDATVSFISGYTAGPRGTSIPTYGSVKLPKPLLRLTAETETSGDGTVHFDGLQWTGSQRTQTVVAGHMDVPGDVNAQKLMEAIIEEVNHDKRDDALVKRMVDVAGSGLADLKQRELSAKREAERLASDVKYLQQQETKDESMIARFLKDIEGRARTIVANQFLRATSLTRINVVVPDGGDYGDQKEFRAWLAINEYAVVDSSIGTIRPKGIQVTVQDMATLERILDGGTEGVKQAYRDGDIKVDGGVVQDILLRAATLSQSFLEK